jgi:hypothetical protein
MDAGQGMAVTSASAGIVAVGVASLVSFVAVFAAVVWKQTNEIIIARRCVVLWGGSYGARCIWARCSLVSPPTSLGARRSSRVRPQCFADTALSPATARLGHAYHWTDAP